MPKDRSFPPLPLATVPGSLSRKGGSQSVGGAWQKGDYVPGVNRHTLGGGNALCPDGLVDASWQT